MYRLIGQVNESKVEVENQTVKALIDSGAQVSLILKSFASKMGLKTLDLEILLGLEGAHGGEVPYLGYTELHLGIPEVKGFTQDVLMLVVPDTNYNALVPIMIGTLHIDMILETATKSELEALSKQWRHGSVNRRVVSQQMRLVEGITQHLEGEVRLRKKVVIGLLETIKVKGVAKIPVLNKRLNVSIDTLAGGDQVVQAVPSYDYLDQGSRNLNVSLQNNSREKVVMKRGTKVAVVMSANIIPPTLAPKKEESDSNKITQEPSQRLQQLLDKLDLSNISDWTDVEQGKVRSLMEKYEHLFALTDLELGKTSLVKHQINLSDAQPFKERYRKIPPHQYEEVKKHLEEMLKVGVIRKSISPWASAVVLVRKKDGSLRFCIDLWKLNNRTIKNAYSLPRIEDSLDCLDGACIFTSLDLKAGYWQVEMSEESIPYTAFMVGPLGFYECVRMPFGLTNALATFQRLMESCLGDLHLKYCIIYLDDIIIFSKTPEEHVERLAQVFEKLSSAGLKLKPSKCEFCKPRIEYLGHIVSKDGIEVNPKKIEAIVKWPRPKTVTQVHSFLGFCNYYPKFIYKFAQIAKPLHKLCSGDNASKKKSLIVWDNECELAFLELKDRCSSTPILAYANYQKPFNIHTDTSELGLGAVLYQEQDDGTNRIIAYASRTLSKSEKKYYLHKLEFLALKWAITE